MNKTIIGILICLSSLWIGFWINSLIPVGHWANVPTFFTWFVMFSTGIALLTNGLANMERGV